ncbi:hypothetical protein Bca52824_026261 [Brassica carinata]|uniref:Uncharacterized protein n=1 Tax=Brassica carinata TaxID=52824 RepID=A0A8X7SHM5_BRACI|nr:hypothetical protein Bca52824_026261 [Brassica carinata]
MFRPYPRTLTTPNQVKEKTQELEEELKLSVFLTINLCVLWAYGPTERDRQGFRISSSYSSVSMSLLFSWTMGEHGRASFWMEKRSGKKYWMLSARKLEQSATAKGTKSFNSTELLVVVKDKSDGSKFLNKSSLARVLTKFWELTHPIFVGTAVAYGLFSRRSVVSRIFQGYSVSTRILCPKELAEEFLRT